jgi:hypothetical protein
MKIQENGDQRQGFSVKKIKITEQIKSREKKITREITIDRLVSFVNGKNQERQKKAYNNNEN